MPDTEPNSTGKDNSADLQQQVEQAAASKSKLNIVGSNSKSFLGLINDAPFIDISSHSGIVSYEPTELVITARAGTKLSEINATLAEYNQTLASSHLHLALMQLSAAPLPVHWQDLPNPISVAHATTSWVAKY